MVQVTATGDQFTHHREELFLHGAAQATVGQFVDSAAGLFLGAADGALLEDFAVDASTKTLMSQDLPQSWQHQMVGSFLSCMVKFEQHWKQNLFLS